MSLGYVDDATKKMNFEFVLVVIIFLLNAKSRICEFNYFEYGKSIEIIRRLEIRHCLFVFDYQQGKILDKVKNFSYENVMTSSMNHQELINYFNFGAFPNFKTIIIMKEKNLLHIAKMFEDFEKFENKAHRFTWLVFVDFYNLTESKNLNIPYNCRFLIALFQLKEKEFKVMEIYHLKNQLHFSEFKTNENLIYPNYYLYLKRMDFNKTEIVMNFDDNSVVVSHLKI